MTLLLEGPQITSLDEYVERGGGAGLRTALDVGADEVLDIVERSGLRGRGGAGFSTGLKWRSIASGGADAGERFVVANGAEGEPGTFKDRALLRHNPYLLLEGLLIAARTVGARRVFVALKSSFASEADVVARFLAVESCGQCSACKLGCQAVTEMLAGLDGVTEGAVYGELSARLAGVTDASRCFLPSQEQRVVASLLADMHDPAMRRPPRGLEVTKIVDLAGDRFVLDERQALKRPDWTYEPD